MAQFSVKIMRLTGSVLGANQQFDPTMTWEAASTGKRSRQTDHSDGAIQTCLAMKLLFGMALRQTTGFVESLPRLIDLDWAVPNFSTLSRH